MGKFYTDDERAQALAFLDACRGNVLEASRRSGVPEKTLAYWRDGGATNRQTAKLRGIKKDDMAALLEQFVKAALPVAIEKVDEAPAGQLLMSVGIAVDKILLLAEYEEYKNDGKQPESRSLPQEARSEEEEAGAAEPERTIKIVYYDDTTSTAARSAEEDQGRSQAI